MPEGARLASFEHQKGVEAPGDQIDRLAKEVLLVRCCAGSPIEFTPTQKGGSLDLAGIDGIFDLPTGLSIEVDFTIASDREGRLGRKVKTANRRTQPMTKHGLPGRLVLQIPRPLQDRLQTLSPEQIAKADRQTIQAANAIIVIFLRELSQYEPAVSRELARDFGQ